MELIKSIGNIIILVLSLGYFGALGRITYELGKSALDLHQRGLVSLSKYNRSLVGNETLK